VVKAECLEREEVNKDEYGPMLWPRPRLATRPANRNRCIAISNPIPSFSQLPANLTDRSTGW
jgi:hypothetical protein